MKKILTFLLLIAVLAGGWYWWSHRSAAVAAEDASKPAAKIETAVLHRQSLAQTLEAFGVVAAAPSGEQVIAAPFDCLIRQVHTGTGAHVAVGDVLLEIDPSPDAKLALDSARSLLALTTKSLAAVQERYDLKLANRTDLLAAQQAEQDARLKVDSFAARGLGGDGRITASVAGVVSKLELSAGSLVPTGSALVTISAGGQLEVRLGVEAADIGSVAAGQSVSLSSANRPALGKISSTVRIAGGSLDAVTGAAEVRVTLPAGGPLLLGEHVRAFIAVQKKDAVLAAPRRAVLPDDDKRILFTVKNGKAVKHLVKVGIATDEYVEVSADDLHEGDIVVTLGNYELEDGMAVQMPQKDEPVAPKPAKEPKP